MNSLPKYVASSTLKDDLDWNNSHVLRLRGDVVGAVRRLKQQPGKDILLYGSQQLFNTLIDHGLIDDFRLWIFPIVLGGGKQLFQPDNRLSKFQLADTTTFSTGVVVLAFRPA